MLQRMFGLLLIALAVIPAKQSWAMFTKIIMPMRAASANAHDTTTVVTHISGLSLHGWQIYAAVGALAVGAIGMAWTGFYFLFSKNESK